jgi:hypothetical protein
MKFRALVLFILFVMVPHLHAQVRKVLGGGGGSVYSNTTASILAGVEIQGKKFEFDTLNIFSPYEAHTGLGTGTAGSFRASGIYWTKSVGLTSSLQFSEYDTVIRKRAYYGLAGIVFRGNPGKDAPMRFELDYVRQVYNKFHADTGIESSYLQGLQAKWTVRLGCSSYGCSRLFTTFDAGHVRLQSNPQCDGTFSGPVTCPRASAWSGGSTGGVVFEFPRPKNVDVY